MNCATSCINVAVGGMTILQTDILLYELENSRLVFLAPLALGQRTFVMALCPLSVSLSVRPLVRAYVHKLLLQETSQKLLTGFLPDFTGMFLRWSSFKLLQIIVFHEEFWLPWQPK